MSSFLTFSRELDWNLLKVFHEVAETGSLTRAADNLQRKQPTVSAALSRLESCVGAQLVERGSRGVTLTPKGRALAQLAKRVCETTEAVSDTLLSAQAAIYGYLNLLVISNMIADDFDRALESFHATYPHVEINVGVAPWRDVHDALLRRETDVGIAPAHFFHPKLHYRELFREVYVPYCGCSHPLYGRHAEVAELRDAYFVLTEGDEPEDLQRFRYEHGLGTYVGGRSAHLEEAKRLARVGVGVCFLPNTLAEPDVRKGHLWPLLTAEQSPSSQLYAIAHHSSVTKLTTRMFIDLLHDTFASRARGAI